MTRRDAGVRRAIENLVDAMQIVVGLAGQVRLSAHVTAEETIALEASVARAVEALRQLQQSAPNRGLRR